ncbi:nucleoside diphosphate kinase 7, putative [Ichthyophthirius multifiliis]|uniref:Nucleoside diphosphate kinase n=1 Tax=Ichthyophthirius multifiliis TaxID=5932 RepID=G0QTD3_ICHMU|nr:nucleoside diphosphate kinase 7, putative [Ichthyophthirius multifiliis]EGR31510.1 nucleoside diphosphate kinase 7, putative [Ichthyophthirius multifiliis]|eukprot:XP_004034996.1 nucleoside diphosphate kinase 7, putative [Ichthyophthirius multifiliis]
MASNDTRYIFVVEWYDKAASLVRTYNLTYFTHDKSIEMYDLKNKRVFLKRNEFPMDEKEFYLGNLITVFSRQLKIVDFADVFTRQRFQEAKQRTFAMIKPDAYNHLGKIISKIEESSLLIANMKMTKFSIQDAQEFYAEHKGKPFYETLTNFMSSDFIVGFELVGENAIKIWRELLGPTNSLVAKEQAPNSIRGLFGTDGTKNACHGSDSPNSAFRELNFFFSEKSQLQTTAIFNNCTCCVIKPHIVKSRQVGQIIDYILREGYEISALQTFTLDLPSAEEFYDVYRGVVPEFNSLAEHLTSGMCVALEVRQENVVSSFRQLCGPHDPEIGKVICENTIRSKFGIDRVRNGVHCTDLEEDGILEVEYFFNILQK